MPQYPRRRPPRSGEIAGLKLASSVTFDTYTVSTGKAVIIFTRIRAPYVNPDGFRFTIYRRGVFSGMGKMLGMQDVEVGFQEFDNDFIIKGNDESRLRQLFANPEIRELIAGQKGINFSVKDDEGWFGPTFPEGVDELAFVVTGVIRDVDRLKRLSNSSRPRSTSSAEWAPPTTQTRG